MRRLLPSICALALALVACGAPAPPPTQSAPLPGQAQGAAVVHYVVGGDSRGDLAHVLPWAFHEAKARRALALLFLGDMETSAELDDRFKAELPALGGVAFYPVLGNHETALREHGASLSRDERLRAIAAFRARFPGTPATRGLDDELAYAVNLPGGVHFVALDNVGTSGFGAAQLAWLAADLAHAKGDGKTRHVVVGMHKALAGSGVTTHAMDEDGPAAVTDSAAALALFEQGHVELIFASHFHGFVEYASHGIKSFITGGLGAPLDADHGAASAFHHLLVLDVRPDAPIAVEVVRFPGAPAVATEHER